MIAQDRKLWVGGYDLSGDLQGLDFQTEIDMQDDTVFGDTNRSNEPGLENFEVQHEGVWRSGVDAVFQSHKGLADVLATLTPVNGAEGAIAYFMRTTQGEYEPGGQVGELFRFSVSLKASGGLGAVRGTLMLNNTLSSSGDGTARQLGALADGASLYAGLHVLSASGSSPTLDVVVESDSAEGFPSATERIAFTQATGIGSEWATPVAGPITDDWWRISWTIGGTGSPAFDAIVVVGLQ